MDLLVDANLPRRYVEELRDMGYEILYVNEMENPSMPDSTIMSLGYELHLPIATQNIKHFLAYDNLIPLKSKKNVNRLVIDTLKYLK